VLKGVLAPNEPKWLLFLQIQTLHLIIHHKLKELFVLDTEPLGNHVEDEVLTESPIEFKYNSITS
jgi:hypothetical protein